MASRRLLLFATSTGVDLDAGRVYPRAKFIDLLTDMLQTSRRLERRGALTIVRDAVASVSGHD